MPAVKKSVVKKAVETVPVRRRNTASVKLEAAEKRIAELEATVAHLTRKLKKKKGK